MKTVELHEENVKKAFKNADASGRQLLELLLPGFNKKSGNVIDRVKTFKDVLSELGLDPSEIYGIPSHLEDHGPAIIAYMKLILVAKALNEGWTPDWENTREYKWFPWFNMQGGFAFSDSYYASAITLSAVGSRLCFKSEELANYAGKQFESLYKDLLTL